MIFLGIIAMVGKVFHKVFFEDDVSTFLYVGFQLLCVDQLVSFISSEWREFQDRLGEHEVGGFSKHLFEKPQTLIRFQVLEIRLSKPLLRFEYMFLLELFTFLWYNVSTSLGLNIFIGVCCLKNTNLLEIVL